MLAAFLGSLLTRLAMTNGFGSTVGYDGLITTNQGGVRNVGLIAQSMSAMISLVAAISTSLASSVAAVQGGITLANATLTIVTVAQMRSSSVVLFTATNSAAASTVAGKGLFVTFKTAGLGFTLSTRTGSAVGTETFDYVVFG